MVARATWTADVACERLIRVLQALGLGERAEGVLLAARHGGLRVTRGHRSYMGRPIMATHKPND